MSASLNVNIPTRTVQEYVLENQNFRSSKKYRNNKKESLTEFFKHQYEQNKETKLNNQKKIMRKIYKKIQEKQKEKIKWVWGCEVRLSNLSLHKKMQKHQNPINQN